MRRLRVLGPRVTVTAGTFHGIAYRLARQRWDDIGRRRPRWHPTGAGSSRRSSVVLRPAASARRRVGGDGRDRLGPLAAARPTGLRRGGVLRSSYRPSCGRRGRALRRVRGPQAQAPSGRLRRPPVAGHRRPAPRSRATPRMRWRFRHVFVDEFQDVNPLQPRCSMPGWVDATTCAWWGTRTRPSTAGRERMGAGWRTSRSTIRAPRWCTSAGATAPAPDRELRSRRAHGASDGAPIASRPDGAPPRAHRFPDAHAEAAAVPALARARAHPAAAGTIAVLARTNAQLEPVAAALQRAAIPFRARDR